MNLKTYLVASFLALVSLSGFAQYQVTLEATVLDQTTLQPIPNANIEFPDKNVKTVTDSTGTFTVSYDEATINPEAVLQLSAFGYQTTQTNASQLYKLLRNTNRIYLIPAVNDNHIDIEKTSINRNENQITGKVTANQKPVQGVSVQVKNTLKDVKTNTDGEYQITATAGEVLRFDFLGMKAQEVLVTTTDSLNVTLQPDGEVLKEVHLKGEAQKKEELIDLGLGGGKSFDAIGTSVNVITAKDIGSQYYKLEDLLNGKFAALNHSREASINNFQGITYDIDGMIFKNDDLPEIDPQNIETLTILTALAATNKYGSRGRGGVIVIRTKTASGAAPPPEKPSALATGNAYTETLKPLTSLAVTPTYLQALQKAQSFEEAKEVYNTLKQNKDNLSIPFYINTADYFLKWNTIYALNILTYTEVLAKDNSKALKTLAFNYESLNELERARLVYQRIAILRPKEAQSYRDLALIYSATGFYTEALQLYKQMLGDQMKGIDFSGLQQPLLDELQNLLSLHRSQINFKDLPAELLTANFKQDLRIVFEWNDPSAQFELQFVNPQQKFYVWQHTQFDNRERLLDEIKSGYTTEAYIIDDAEAGEWIINIRAINEEPSINPNYLKYTIYKNYGLETETKTVKVIPLQNLQEKVILDQFMYE